jgi:hypothetical protein
MNSTPKPFLPSDLASDKLLIRAATAYVVAAARTGATPEQICRQFWPKDAPALAMVLRAATGPALTTQATWAQELAAIGVGTFLANLQNSGAAALLRAAPQFDLSGYAKINLPRAAANGTARWVGEGQPIPAGQAQLANTPLGPPFKLALIETFSNELRDHSAPAAEQVVGQILSDAARIALDSALFSAAAGTANNPPGLLAGLTSLTPFTGGGPGACLGDLRQLADAVATAGGGGNLLYFTTPGRLTAVKGYAPAVAPQVHASAMIPASQIICIDASAFASGFGADPQITAAQEVLLHQEDTTPLPIASVGTPNTVAAPTRSMFQTDCTALKMVLRCAWVLRIPNTVAFITGAAW